MRQYIGPLGSLLQPPRLQADDQVPDLSVSSGMPEGFVSYGPQVDLSPPLPPQQPFVPPTYDAYGTPVPPMDVPEAPPPPYYRNPLLDAYYTPPAPPEDAPAPPAKLALGKDSKKGPASRPAASLALGKKAADVDETKFQQWYAQKAKQYDLSSDPDDPNQFYDYRAAYAAGAQPDKTGHWPSAFKLPGHPNMVVGGFNTQTSARVPGTPRASEADLVKLGWDPADAKRLAATPEPVSAKDQTAATIMGGFDKKWATPTIPAVTGEAAAQRTAATDASFRLQTPVEQQYVQGAKALTQSYQAKADPHLQALKDLSPQIAKQQPAIAKDQTALTAEGAALDDRAKGLVEAGAAFTAKQQALQQSLAANPDAGNQPSAVLALRQEQAALTKQFDALNSDLKAFDTKRQAFAQRVTGYNGLVEQQRAAADAVAAISADAKTALQQHTAAFLQTQQAGPRQATPQPVFPGPQIPAALLQKFQPATAPPAAGGTLRLANEPTTWDRIDPRTGRTISVPLDASTKDVARATGDLFRAGLGVPIGITTGIGTAIGEKISGAMPGHEAETDSIVGHLVAHAKMILQGQGGAIMPGDVFGNPPDSTLTDEEQIHRAEMGLPAVKTRPVAQKRVEEVARQGVNLAARAAIDPVTYAAFGLQGPAGELISGAFAADGIRNAVEVARDPNSTPESVAIAMLMAGFQSLPVATRMSGGAAYALGKEVRARLIAARLQFPDTTRAFGATSHEGVHAPIAAMEDIGGAGEGLRPGETLDLLTLANGKNASSIPDVIRWTLGDRDTSPSYQSPNEAKPPAVVLPKEMRPGATVQTPHGEATIVATDIPTHGIPSVTVRDANGQLGAYRPDVLNVTAPVPVDLLPPGEVIGRIVDAGSAAEAAQLKDTLLQRIGRAAASETPMPDAARDALRDLAAKHPDDVGVGQLRDAFQLLQAVAPEEAPQPLQQPEPKKPVAGKAPEGTKQWVENGTLYIQFKGQTFQARPGDPAPTVVPADQAPTPPPTAAAPTNTGPVTPGEVDALRNIGLKAEHIAALTPEEVRGVLAGTIPIPAPPPPQAEPQSEAVPETGGTAPTAAAHAAARQRMQELAATADRWTPAQESEYQHLKGIVGAREHTPSPAAQENEAARRQPVASFTTAQGSTYAVTKQSTTRTKANGEAFTPSDRTIYLDQQTASRAQAYIESLGSSDQFTARPQAVGDQVLIVVKDKATGEVRNDLTRTITGSDHPAVGLHPFEVWNKNPATGERMWHFGNAITAVEAAPAAPAAAPQAARPVAPPASRPATPLPNPAMTPAPVADTVAAAAEPAASGGYEITDKDIEDIAAALRAELEPEQAAAPEGPRWRAGSAYDTADNAAPDALAATIEEQTGRRIAIAKLADRLTELEPGSPKFEKATAQLRQEQQTYDDTWEQIDTHMEGVDSKTLDADIEAEAARVVREERYARERAEKDKGTKATKAKAPTVEETPAEEPAARPRRNAMGTTALEDALSPKAQAGLATMFKSWDRQRDLRHVREAMEIYQHLIDRAAEGEDDTAGDEQAAQLAQTLLDATEAYFGAKGPARAVSDAAYAGLQHITGEEDPDWNQLLENEVFASAKDAGDLIFDTLDPKTAEFDIEEFNTAYGEVEFRRDPHAVFPEPKDTVNLWEGRKTRETISHAAGEQQIADWQAAAKAEGEKPGNENYKKVVISLYDRTGIISQPWADAGYSVRRFDIRAGEDLTDFGTWMDEIEQILAEGYTIVGVLAQPPCTSFTVSGAQHWPGKHDAPNHEWLVKTYGEKAAEHFDTPLDYANTLVAVVKLVVAQANPKFYAMENPVGRIAEQNNLPAPVLKFNPDDFGEPYTKATQLWGEFNPHLPTARVHGEKAEGGEGSRTWNLSSAAKDERSLTPVGFAYAFFMGNRKLAAQPWENSERPAAEEPEGKYAPEDHRAPVSHQVEDPQDEEAEEAPPVISFRSGNQTSPVDAAAFIKAGQDVGVTALDMLPSVRAQIVDHVANGGSAFIDSGAFGRTVIEDGQGRSTIDFEAVLSTYDAVARDVVRAGGDPARLYVVAPDVAPAFVDPKNRDRIVARKQGVPRSFPDETAAIQTRYAGDIKTALKAGLQVIVPVQVGPAMTSRAIEVVQQFRGATIGLPGNQGAISDEQFTDMLAAMQEAGVDPEGFHFLGIGEKNARLGHLVKLVRATFPIAAIASDAARAPAMFGKGRPAQEQVETRIRELAALDADDDVDDTALTVGLAGEFFRGEWEKFTDDELTQVFAAAGVSKADAWHARRQVQSGNDTTAIDALFGHTEMEAQARQAADAAIAGEPEGEDDGLAPIVEALWNIGKARGEASKSNKGQARGEVITARDQKHAFVARDDKMGTRTFSDPLDASVWNALNSTVGAPSRIAKARKLDDAGFAAFVKKEIGIAGSGHDGYSYEVTKNNGEMRVTGPHGTTTYPLTTVAATARRLLDELRPNATSQPPVSRPVKVPAPTPNAPVEGQLKTTWMNESSIEEAVQRFAKDPVLGPAANFLNAFKDEVNAHSDGWPYWKQPTHAAGKLQALVYGHLMAGMGAYPRLPKATAVDVLVTLPPIKAFMTKRGTAAGLSMQPFVDLAKALGAEGATRVQPPAQAGQAPAAATQPEGQAEGPEKVEGQRKHYEDGRIIPESGDKVYQTVRGFGGTPAQIRGEVFEGKKKQLRVRVTGAVSFIGGTSSTGKTFKLDPSWTLVGDPEILRRQVAREQAEKDRREQDAREQAAFEAETIAKADAAIAGGHAPLTRATPVGSQVVDYWTGDTRTVDEQHPEYGPLLDGSTLGHGLADGTWAGYSVLPAAAPAASTEPQAWGHAATMSPGAAVAWFQNVMEDGPVRVRTAVGHEGWAVSTVGERNGDRWIDVGFDDGTRRGVPALELEPAWRNGQLVHREGTKAPASRPAVSQPTKTAIEQEREALEAEGADLIRQLREELKRIGANTPLDPKVISLVVKLAANFVKRGIVEFKDAAQRFRAEFGENAQADTYFELAWPVAQEMAKGQTLPAALATAKAQKGRPTVAGAIRAAAAITVTPNPDLTGEAAAVQARAIAALEQAPLRFRQAYLDRFGRVLNADNASELFDDYAQSSDSRATLVAAVRAPAGALIDALYRDMLAAPPTVLNPVVVFTAGGNASGKTTGVTDEKAADLIFDSTLSSLPISQAKIEQARAAGRSVLIRYTYRDPKAALESALVRAQGEANGRTVTVRGLVGTTIGARETVLALADRYASDPDVFFKIRENTGVSTVPRDVAWLAAHPYNERRELESSLFTALEQARDAGTISDAVYRGTRGLGRRSGEDLAADGRGVRPERGQEQGDTGPEAGGAGSRAPEGVRGPDDVIDRPGLAPESGRAGADAVRDGSPGPLGEVPAEAGVGAEGAGTGRAGTGDTEGGPSADVPGVAHAGEEPGAAPRPDRGNVPVGGLPTAGGVAGPVGIAGDQPGDYTLTPERIAGIINRGNVTRLADNVAAIRLVKDLQTEHRYATPDEQDVLAKYVGWGASDIQQYLEERPRYGWSANEKTLWQEFRDMTSPDQRKEMIRSSPNAHFTFDLYRPIWSALTRFGFTGGRVLEPSVGTGHAIGLMPPETRGNSTINASELDPMTAAIASYLYPSARVQPVGYEKIRLSRNTQDLAISNVPFGRFGVEDRLFTGALKFITEKIHSYFYAKAMEHLRPGGYMVFITSRYTMDGPEHLNIRRYLMTKGHFVGAVRLPGGSKGAFVKAAKTEVVTDLIVLQKFQPGETDARNKDLFIQSPKLEEFSTEAGKDHRGRKTSARNVYRSAWYTAHPQFILGTEAMTGSQYSANEYTVEARPDEDVQAALETALQVVLPTDAYQRATTTSTEPDAKVAEGAFKPGELRAGENGAIQRVLLSGEIVDATPRKKDGTVDTKTVQRVLGQIKIRDARRVVIDTMRSTTASTADVQKVQGVLLRTYKKFQKEYGDLNSQANRNAFKSDPEASALRGLETLETTSKITVDKNGKRLLRVTHEVKGLADIFDKRTINATPQIEHVDTPTDALLASLGTRTNIDWPFMARITGDHTVSQDRITALQDALKAEGRVFEQPDGSWVASDEYLSGDVVSKLADAHDAAADDETGRWAGNIAALDAVQPAPKTAEQIQIALGVHWVQPADLARFVDDAVGREGTKMRLDGSEQYVRWTSEYPPSVEAAGNKHPLAVRYGRDNEKVYGFTKLLDDALNLKTPELGYTEENAQGNRIFIKQESQTIAARANIEELRQLWTQWVYNQRDVLDRIVDVYNTRYNRTVQREYDGTHLANYTNEKGEPTTPADGGTRSAALPGLALPFLLYKHQLRAIWRVLTSGNTLLAHEVGAGKTFEMIVAAMEMRRTGRAQKPMITVPTYLLAQWRKDVAKAYPTAKLLAFEEKDLASDRRQEAMSRIAHGDWDIVLVPHSSFELLKVSQARMAATLQEWIDEITAVEEENRARYGKDDLSVKKLEEARRRIEDKARKLLEKADKGEDNALVWEDLGVDALLVDEAHAFKNLYFFSKMDQIRGLSRSSADKSLDMFIKVKDINESSNYRNLVFATATPVMNSLAEVYTMQRYLQPQRLRELGFENFDNWYATFAQAKVLTEQRPDGTYHEVNRVAKFRNGKLLYRIVSDIMDYVGWDDMPYLKLPKLENGRITIVQGEPHPMYDVIQQWFTKRLAAIRETPPHYDKNRKEYIAPDRFHPITGNKMIGAKGQVAKDNILTIMNDAKLAAIDARLVLGTHAQDVANSRVQEVAKRVSDYYKKETPKKGVALLFLDVGTPKTAEPLEFLGGATVDDTTGGDALGVEEAPDDEDAAALASGDYEGAFNMYEAIKKALIARGVKSSEIAYIHQARNSAERLALFQAAQEGTVRVLLASTDKGGLGMNIQDRLGMIVEVDAPRAMRPGDIRQRHGRGIRQGNTYDTIQILRFITKGTTDEWLYGLLGKKQGMITDFMRGELDEYEDDDPTTMSLEEAEVRATNDPRKIELLNLTSSLPRLEAQATAAERAIAEAKAEVAHERARLPGLMKAHELLASWVRDSYKRIAGDDFAMTVGDQAYTTRTDANTALIAALTPLADKALTLEQFGSGTEAWQQVGEVGGLPIMARPTISRYNAEQSVKVTLDADTAGEGDIDLGELMVGIDGKAKGTFGEGRNLVASIQDRYNGLPSRAVGYEQDIKRTEERIARAEKLVAHPSDAPAKIAAARARITAIESELRAESAIKDAEAGRAHQEEKLARSIRGPSGEASMGDYAESEFPTEEGVTLRPIEFPELVDLARELQRVPQVVKRFRSEGVRGMFTPGGIRLHRDLFKPGNELQLAATLAHEIGHLVDWLPDYTLKRGNILGHLQVLTDFLKGEYDDAAGVTIKNAEVRDELLKLSTKWRPWDEATASTSFKRYRRSAKELYADAISVMLNNPDMLQREAPIFYRAFFDNLDLKPSVKRAYFGLLELLSGDRAELVARRRAGVQGMFREANTKSADLLRQKVDERKARARDFEQRLWHLRGELVEKHAPFQQRLGKDRAQGETPIAPEENPYYALSERPYRLAGSPKAWLHEHIQPLYATLHAAGLDWDQLGEALMYQRIIGGDRSTIANPRGIRPTDAPELYIDMLNRLTPDQRTVLKDSITAFRAAVKDVAREAYEAGLYTKQTWDGIDANTAYSTYHTIEHMADGVSSRIHHQIGTLKDITNPADATILKAIVTLRAIEYQRAKVVPIEYLQSRFPADVQNARLDQKGKPLPPPKNDQDLQLVTYFKDGRQVGVYVDPYIGASLNMENPYRNMQVVKLASAANQWFRGVLTGLRPGFQMSNILRDALRYWRNLPGGTRRGMAQRYWQARHLSAARVWGLASPEASAMRKAYRAVLGRPTSAPTSAEVQGWKDLVAAERIGILGPTFREHGAHDIADTHLENILMMAGVGPFANKPRHVLLKPVVALLDTIKNLGDFIETLPKAAAIYDFASKRQEGGIADIPPDQRQFIRAKVGSPDYLAGGTLKPVTNNLLLFSNAQAQAILSDLEVATDPTTAAGFWWKTVQANLLPKFLTMAALMAAAGALATDDKATNPAVRAVEKFLAQFAPLVEAGKILRKVPQYDLTQYTVIPLGTDAHGNAIVARIPQDDNGRFLGGVFWKLLQAATGDRGLWQTLKDAFGYAGSQLPSMTPALSTVASAADYASGRNPYDAFRQKNLLTDDEQKARDLTWEPFRKFAGWEFQQVGGSVVWKFYPGDERPKQQTAAQKFLDAPIVSDTLGRYIKVTKYGETERNRAAATPVDASAAARRISEQAAVNEALAKYFALPKAQQNIQTQDRMGKDLARQLYPDEKDAQKKANDVRRLTSRLTLSVVHGEDDALADVVIGATTNEAKVAIIVRAQPDYTPDQFEKWLHEAVRQHVISPQVLVDVKKKLRAPATVH